METLIADGTCPAEFDDECQKYYWNWPDQILSLVARCQRKTDELSKSKEVLGALKDLSKVKNYAHSAANSEFCPDFVDFVGEILRSVVDENLNYIPRELLCIRRYLNGVPQGLRSGSEDVFLSHVQSVILRIAFQTCNFWFNGGGLISESDDFLSRVNLKVSVNFWLNRTVTPKTVATRLVDLHKEIDPSNPDFLELNLRFQASLRVSHESHFCDYLFAWTGEEDLRKELKSLVTLFINTTLEDGEDVQSLFAEVRAVLAEAAFSHRWEAEAERLHRPGLGTKICLLKAELFLKELLNTGTPSATLLNVDTILTSLRAFTNYATQQSLALAGELANQIDSLHSKSITSPLVRHSLLQLLFKVVFFKAESFLTHLLESNESSSIANAQKAQIVSLVDVLSYFKRIVTNKLARNSSDKEIHIIQVEAVARGITLLSYSFLPKNKKFRKMIHSLPQLLGRAKTIRAKLTEMGQQFPKCIFPMTYEMGFIDFLGRNIRKLLEHDPESIAPVKHQIEEVQVHLQSLKSFLLNVKDSDVRQTKLKDLYNHIIDVAYKLEYVVESIEIDGHLQLSLWLHDLLEKIRLADQQAPQIQEMSCSSKVQNNKMLPRDTKATVNEMVDLDDQQEAIIDRLIRGSKQRSVVSIVGMGGIGKTTLAQRLYENKIITHHFHCRAWCTVSEVYSERELLLEILSHILKLTDEIRQMSESDLQLKLRRCLLGKRYLIVMDDVWDIAAWNNLEKSFPDKSNGSRILITSRLQGEVSKIIPDCDPHCLRELSDCESWMLLRKKIFRGGNCPEQLLQVGMEIAKKCQGLPLAVVAIAGILRTTEKSQHSWKEISESLCSKISSNAEIQCKEILVRSYKHLPEHLKACFLYLGVFLDQKNIPVRKLIHFWVAEGFIQESQLKSLEDVAEDYLMELIQRSLVIISKTSRDGKVKECQLHDLLRDLCLSKAKEENFFQPVTKKYEPYCSFLDSDYVKEFEDGSQLAPPTFGSYRLSFYLKRHHFIDSRPSGQGTRSLLFFASTDLEPKCPYDISFICQNFKLLRVLYLEYLNMESSFPVEIGQMVQLRYLAVSGYMKSIPPSIANLWKLETLVVKGLRDKVILPETIWSMAMLRHLHVNHHVTFQSLDPQFEHSFLLGNLLSFSTPSLRFGEDTKRIFRWMPNLRRLKCIFQSQFSPENCSDFRMLELLTHLESLKIIYHGGDLKLREFILPTNLKKLTLSNFRLGQNHIYMIGELNNLRVLKLLAGSFEEQRWDMREEDFKELKFLELDTMNIVKWNASYEHLPSLEWLVLRNCQYLTSIPSEFSDITTLQKIEVLWCGLRVEVSAEEIGQAREEIKVFISCS